jgi:hypothetical protein
MPSMYMHLLVVTYVPVAKICGDTYLATNMIELLRHIFTFGTMKSSLILQTLGLHSQIVYTQLVGKDASSVVEPSVR